jgi:predicted ATPase
MSLEAIRLENFRGFSDASIELKPLTVLLGANSSGKSSFGHALAAMAHAHSRDEGTLQASLTPHSDPAEWPVDLGTLDDLRTQGALGPVYIELVTSKGTVKWGFGLDSVKSETRDLIVSYIEWPKALEFSGTKPADTLPPPIPQLEEAKITIPTGNLVLHQGATAHLKNKSHRTFDRLNLQQWREVPGDTQTTVVLRGLILNTAMHAAGTSVELNNEVLNETRKIFDSLTYLRAIRNRPIRAYDESRIRSRQAIGYAGEKTALVLHKRGNEQLIVKLPPPIPNHSSEVTDLMDKAWEERSFTLNEAAGAWLQHLQLANSITTVQSEIDSSIHKVRITLPGQQSHDITEVGFGVSQVLPVLVAGLLQPKDSLFIVDLPEAHLHPRPQAELADFFCSLALSDRSVLVETHSEMFINQLRLRAEMTPGLMDKIAVYFIDPPENGRCSQPRPIDLSSEGELRWPAGFLQESWEIETRISSVREARRKAAK